MSDNEKDRTSPIEVVGDENWKDQVKAEDAKRDAERSAATQQDSSAKPEFPAATFGTLVQTLSTQALVCLGLIPTPDGQVRCHLEAAKHFIDLLAVLEEKTRRNLTGHEANQLEITLHELRLAFVEVSKNQRDGQAVDRSNQ